MPPLSGHTSVLVHNQYLVVMGGLMLSLDDFSTVPTINKAHCWILDTGWWWL